MMHLKRYWQKAQLQKNGGLAPDAFPDEWTTDITLLAALGPGLEQTVKHMFETTESFETFEQWAKEVNSHQLSATKIEAFNKSITDAVDRTGTDTIENVLSEEDLHFWNANGYVLLKNAVSKQDCENTIQLICDFISVDVSDAATWYNEHPARQGIMVQLFQHPILQKNRANAYIRKAYEQLWKRKDIWVNTDRVGFNPPETTFWKFPGPNLHWDVSLKLPIPFGLQGILYLSDTEATQGAFTLAPGFQNSIEQWLNNLPAGTNPRTADFYALGATPVVANAGDFIIWHHALPHGSSRNTSAKPRFVQYINYAPLDAEVQTEWS
ncbi:MAG: phytanoyl-CoA dioxygenase family protein [Chitinophagaceae bacterium]|nr:phytanoyl-CoA dioxygenase family protein [Chitinophagaceae bacterium]